MPTRAITIAELLRWSPGTNSKALINSKELLPTKRVVLQRLLHEQNWHGTIQYKLFQKNFPKYGFNRTRTQFHNKQFHKEFSILSSVQENLALFYIQRRSCILRNGGGFYQ